MKDKRVAAEKKAALSVGRVVISVVVVACLGWAGTSFWSRAGRKHPSAQAERALSHESTLRSMVEGYNQEYRREAATNLAVADPRRVMAELDGTREALLDHYREYFRYPHNSRPLNADMSSLLDPLSAQILPSPVFKRAPRASVAKPAYYVHFAAPRQAVAGSETFTATVRVTDASTGQLVKPTIDRALILSDVKTGRVKLAEVAPEASSTDGVFAFSWKPPAKTRLFWGDLELRVDLHIGETAVSRELGFSSTPAEPAQFTGKFSEALVEGSLVVSAEIRATDAGSYVFEGNLYHQGSNEPVSWSRNLVALEEGTQEVKFLFFGKIFHDKGLDGAFVLRQLRGYRLNRPYDPAAMLDQRTFLAQQQSLTADQRARISEVSDEPVHAFVAVWPLDYVTASYDLESFADREYDGEDKTRTLERIQAYNETAE